MTIQVVKKELLDALNINNISQINKSIPILQNLKLTINSNNIKIASTDLETLIITNVDLINPIMDDKLEFLVDKKKFYEIISTMKDTNISLNIIDKQIQIKGFYSKSSLPIIFDIDEYASTEINEENYSKLIDLENINETILNAFNFIGHDEMRPTMNGVNLSKENEILYICSTNANYLFSDFITTDNEQFNFSIIIPPVASKIFKLKDEFELWIDADFKNIIVVNELFKIRIRLIDGRFPNFKSVIPTNNELNVWFNKNELISAIKSVSISSNVSTNTISLIVHNDDVLLIAQDFDNSISSYSIVKAKDSNIDNYFKISLNHVYLNKLLSIIKEDTICFKMQASNRPIIIKTESDRILLLMPVIGNEDNIEEEFNTHISEIKNIRNDKISDVKVILNEEDDIDFSALGKSITGEDGDIEISDIPDNYIQD